MMMMMIVLNVQKRLGARILTGEQICRICGEHLDPQLEHSETCATAEATVEYVPLPPSST